MPQTVGDGKLSEFNISYWKKFGLKTKNYISSKAGYLKRSRGEALVEESKLIEFPNLKR